MEVNPEIVCNGLLSSSDQLRKVDLVMQGISQQRNLGFLLDNLNLIQGALQQGIVNEEFSHWVQDAPHEPRSKLADCLSLGSPELKIDTSQPEHQDFKNITVLPSLLMDNYSSFELIGFTSLRHIPCLPKDAKVITLKDCPALQSLPEMPRGLEKLDISGCASLENLPHDLPLLSNLKEMDASGCHALQGVPNRWPDRLETVCFDNCPSLPEDIVAEWKAKNLDQASFKKLMETAKYSEAEMQTLTMLWKNANSIAKESGAGSFISFLNRVISLKDENYVGLTQQENSRAILDSIKPITAVVCGFVSAREAIFAAAQDADEDCIDRIASCLESMQSIALFAVLKEKNATIEQLTVFAQKLYVLKLIDKFAFDVVNALWEVDNTYAGELREDLLGVEVPDWMLSYDDVGHSEAKLWPANKENTGPSYDDMLSVQLALRHHFYNDVKFRQLLPFQVPIRTKSSNYVLNLLKKLDTEFVHTKVGNLSPLYICEQRMMKEYFGDIQAMLHGVSNLPEWQKFTIDKKKQDYQKLCDIWDKKLEEIEEKKEKGKLDNRSYLAAVTKLQNDREAAIANFVYMKTWEVVEPHSIRRRLEEDNPFFPIKNKTLVYGTVGISLLVGLTSALALAKMKPKE